MTSDERAPTLVNELADRFWEAVLELDPTLASFYGDERYADRLEDPGPDGRAASRALLEQTVAEARAIAPDGLPTEDSITRDMLIVVAELGIEQDDQALHQLRVVDQMRGPQQLLPDLTQIQAADSAERFDAFIARLHAYPAFMAANAQILRDGMASGLTAPRIVAERTIAQIERMLAVPIESAIVPSMVRVKDEAERERVRTIVRDVVYPADAAFLEALKGDYLAATREEPGIGPPRTGSSSIARRSAPGRAWSWTPLRSTGSGSTNSRRSRLSGARSRVTRATGMTRPRIVRRWMRTLPTPRRRRRR